MIITIDFFNKVVWVQNLDYKDVPKLGEAIELFGYKNEEFEFQSVMQFDNDNTGDAEVVYTNDKEVN